MTNSEAEEEEEAAEQRRRLPAMWTTKGTRAKQMLQCLFVMCTKDPEWMKMNEQREGKEQNASRSRKMVNAKKKKRQIMLFVCVHCLLNGEQRVEVKWNEPGKKCGSVDSNAIRVSLTCRVSQCFLIFFSLPSVATQQSRESFISLSHFRFIQRNARSFSFPFPFPPRLAGHELWALFARTKTTTPLERSGARRSDASLSAIKVECCGLQMHSPD